MSDLDSQAARIAEAAASAWWKAHGGSRDEIPLGVVAALALMTQVDRKGANPRALILSADREKIADLLRHIWTSFAIVRPELSIRVGPFAAWLDHATDAQLDGAHATVHAVVKAGQLDLTGDRSVAAEVDLLGHVYQQLRSDKAKKAHGEIYTPTALADALARMGLAGIKPGQTICDPCAGTGGLLRAAAQALRASGIDPHSMWWYAADIDPVVVAGLAVNVHVWDLGERVVVGCADTLAEPDWQERALAEQRTAIEQHAMRVMAARFLALDRLLARGVDDRGDALIGKSGGHSREEEQE